MISIFQPSNSKQMRPNRSIIPAFILASAVTLYPVADIMGQSGKNVFEQVSDPGADCDTTAWKLVFSDEFEGTELDRTKWITYFPYSVDGSDQCEGCRKMGTSNTIFRDEEVTVNDGTLKLGVSAKENQWYSLTKEHQGGMIHTTGDAKFTYGRFEIRCRIPSEKGLWPAFWGFGGETEIDVFEICGEKPKWMKGALHQWGDTKYSSNGKHKDEDLSKDYHIYAVEWEKDEIRWYLDGEQVHARSRYVDRKGKPLLGCDRQAGTRGKAPYYPREEDKVNIIINLTVSEPKGFCKGPKEPEPWPEDAVLEVDWVRVYQRVP
jgi:beta-glucanase (GH16 family)